MVNGEGWKGGRVEGGKERKRRLKAWKGERVEGWTERKRCLEGSRGGRVARWNGRKAKGETWTAAALNSFPLVRLGSVWFGMVQAWYFRKDGSDIGGWQGAREGECSVRGPTCEDLIINNGCINLVAFAKYENAHIPHHLSFRRFVRRARKGTVGRDIQQ